MTTYKYCQMTTYKYCATTADRPISTNVQTGDSYDYLVTRSNSGTVKVLTSAKDKAK